jgi:hypothetical protein
MAIFSNETPYWVFVNAPHIFSIDREVFEKPIEQCNWSVNQSDGKEMFPGQLGLMRVGIDKRNKAELGQRHKLEAGIYGIFQIESKMYEDESFVPDEEKQRYYVDIRYLKMYSSPLTMKTLKEKEPETFFHLNIRQRSSFPISAEDFRTVLRLLGEDEETLVDWVGKTIPTDLDKAEEEYAHASPEAKEVLSRRIERGDIGEHVKKANGYRCQICAALGRDPVGFLKRDNTPYIEAHHVVPVASLEKGVLAASNVIAVCANHHRQLHYGNVSVRIENAAFAISINGKYLRIPKHPSK